MGEHSEGLHHDPPKLPFEPYLPSRVDADGINQWEAWNQRLLIGPLTDMQMRGNVTSWDKSSAIFPFWLWKEGGAVGGGWMGAGGLSGGAGGKPGPILHGRLDAAKARMLLYRRRCCPDC